MHKLGTCKWEKHSNFFWSFTFCSSFRFVSTILTPPVRVKRKLNFFFFWFFLLKKWKTSRKIFRSEFSKVKGDVETFRKLEFLSGKWKKQKKDNFSLHLNVYSFLSDNILRTSGKGRPSTAVISAIHLLPRLINRVIFSCHDRNA